MAKFTIFSNLSTKKTRLDDITKVSDKIELLKDKFNLDNTFIRSPVNLKTTNDSPDNELNIDLSSFLGTVKYVVIKSDFDIDIFPCGISNPAIQNCQYFLIKGTPTSLKVVNNSATNEPQVEILIALDES